MKVLQLASGDLWAGAEVQLYYLAKALHRHPEVELSVVLLNEGQLAQRLREQGIPVQVFDESRLSSGQIGRELYRLMRRLRPALLHTHRLKENIVGSVAAALNGVPSLRSVHGDSEHRGLKQTLFESVNRFCGRHLQAGIIAVSEELRGKLLPVYGPERLTVIENSLDAAELEALAARGPAPEWEPGPLHVGLVGRMVEVKRADLFLDIAERTLLAAPDADIRFHLIGDGPLLEGLRASAAERGLESRVRFHGFVANTAPWLQALDLLLFTSDHEGLPMTLLEAMTLETPVMYRPGLATIHQVLDDGACGFRIDSDRCEDFASAILELRGRPEELKTRAEQARQRLFQRYDSSVKLGEYLDLYRRVLG